MGGSRYWLSIELIIRSLRRSFTPCAAGIHTEILGFDRSLLGDGRLKKAAERQLRRCHILLVKCRRLVHVPISEKRKVTELQFKLIRRSYNFVKKYHYRLVDAYHDRRDRVYEDMAMDHD